MVPEQDASKQSRTMRLCALLSGAGYAEGAWRLPHADARCNTDADYFCRLATLAEEAGFDAVFLADTMAVWSDVRRRPAGVIEPSVLAASILSSTRSIGVVITLSTTFNEPFNIARRLASLDWTSKGRIGWNIVTSTTDEAAQNFGLASMPSHEERYARCSEFVKVCIGLWSTWGPNSVIADKSGDWARPDLVVPLEHSGRHFRVKGPLDVPRSPQIVPLLGQAGSSEWGVDLAASYADAVFVMQNDLVTARRYRSKLHHRIERIGRTRAVTLLPGLMPVVADSEHEALRQLDHLDSLARLDLGVEALERYIGLPSGSLSLDQTFDVDLPPEHTVEGNRSLYRVLLGMAGGRNTVRDVLQTMNAGRGHLLALGTGAHVAETMIRWFDQGAADGFNVIFPTLPSSLERFATEVVPILRERGYLADACASSKKTLRERFECPWTPGPEVAESRR